MNNVKLLVEMACFAAVSAASAAPSVSNVRMEQDASTRAVTVRYTLTGGPAVVTAGVTTNGVPVGDAHIARTYGDIHQVIRADGEHVFTWLPDRTEQDNAFSVDGGARVTVTAWPTNNPPPVMAVDLAMTNHVLYFASVDALPEGGLKGRRCKTSLLVLKRIPAGGREFVMGRQKNVTFYKSESGNGESEYNEPPHQVSLRSDFYLGVFELTQCQWDLVCRKTISTDANFTNALYAATRPMENISWYDLRESTNNTYSFEYRYPNDPHPQSFLGLIRACTGVAFELPGEVEWEFAANAGLRSTMVGDGAALSEANLNKIGRTYSNWPGTFVEDFSLIRHVAIDQGTAEVGSYRPNLFGLYDMNGNVWEWTLDWYLKDRHHLDGDICLDSAIYGKVVIRGGSAGSETSDCRSQRRFPRVPSTRNPNTGVRLKAPVVAH